MVCLRVVKERMSHAAAVSVCAEHRASLVMVKDANYYHFLVQLLMGQSTLIFVFLKMMMRIMATTTTMMITTVELLNLLFCCCYN